jgi:hypothetical protein
LITVQAILKMSPGERLIFFLKPAMDIAGGGKSRND